MKNKIAKLVVLLLFLPLISGCAVVVAGGVGAGAVAYIKGELQANIHAPLDRTAAATRLAVDDLKFLTVSEQFDSFGGEIIVRTALDKRITIKLSRVASNITKVSIRVGVFGDQEMSYIVLEKIKEKL